jgi:hypothetical protein
LAANEDATAMTPERLAALEAAAAHEDQSAGAVLDSMLAAAGAAVATPARPNAPAADDFAADDLPVDNGSAQEHSAEPPQRVAGRRFSRR